MTFRYQGGYASPSTFHVTGSSIVCLTQTSPGMFLRRPGSVSFVPRRRGRVSYCSDFMDGRGPELLKSLERGVQGRLWNLPASGS